jgi:hypothetical protein
MKFRSISVLLPFSPVLILLLVITLMSCGNDTPTGGPSTPPEPVDTSAFYYPKKNDSRWDYTRIQSVENIRPDSIIYKFSMYPITSGGYIKIMYDTVLAGETLKVFYEEYTDAFGTSGSRHYYKMDTTAMISFAYRGVGGTTFPFRPAEGNMNISFIRNGIDVWEGFYGPYGSNDSLIYETDRPIVLKYPIKTGTQWILRNIGAATLTKKYIGYENVHIDSAVYSCMKVQRVWSNESNYILYDYVSKYGQIKRDYLFKNMAVTNMLGQTIGYVDFRDIVLVNNISGIE